MRRKSEDNGKRQVRRYTPTERMGVMFIALRDGIAQTAQAQGIPERTLRGWFLEAGSGVAEIRRFVEAETLYSYLRAQRAIFDTVADRVSAMGDPQLLRAFEAAIPKMAAADQQALAAAQASASVHNWVIHVDGEPLEVKSDK